MSKAVVLLIEDNPGDALLIREYLRESGAPLELEVANTLQAGLARLAEIKPAVVLLDLGLPDSEGLDTFLRVHARAADLPVVLLSGLQDESTALRAMEGGAQDYLLKGEASGSLLVRTLRYAIERKRNEVELRRTWRYARSLIEASLDPFVTISPEGKITDVNRATEEATGLLREELVGSDFAVYFTEPDKAREGYQQVIAEGLVRDYPLTIRHRTGDTMDVLYNASVYRNEAGELQGVFAAARDVTERKRAEEALQRAHLELERRAEQLRALVSEVSLAEQRERHRLAQMLHDDLQQLLAAAKLRVAAAAMRADTDAVQEALRLADDLLDQSIQACRSLSMDISPPVLYEMGLTPALRWLAQWMGDKHGLGVEIQAEDDVSTPAEGVRVLLFQAVRELLFNVVKHAGTDRARVRVNRQRDGWVQIEVADEGNGFGPAHCVDDAPPSTGFGLLSIRERLDLVGGRMEIESAPDQGTRINLHAPLTATEGAGPRVLLREPAIPVRGNASQAGLQPRIRVLLAGQRPALRETVRSLLQGQADIELVGEAEDAHAALERVGALCPHVVVMHVSHELDGVEAARRIAAQHPQVGIIGLASGDLVTLTEAMRRAGASACLAVDAPKEVLLATIRAAYHTRR